MLLGSSRAEGEGTAPSRSQDLGVSLPGRWQVAQIDVCKGGQGGKVGELRDVGNVTMPRKQTLDTTECPFPRWDKAFF